MLLFMALFDLQAGWLCLCGHPELLIYQASQDEKGHQEPARVAVHTCGVMILRCGLLAANQGRLKNDEFLHVGREHDLFSCSQYLARELEIELQTLARHIDRTDDRGGSFAAIPGFSYQDGVAPDCGQHKSTKTSTARPTSSETGILTPTSTIGKPGKADPEMGNLDRYFAQDRAQL